MIVVYLFIINPFQGSGPVQGSGFNIGQPRENLVSEKHTSPLALSDKRCQQIVMG